MYLVSIALETIFMQDMTKSTNIVKNVDNDFDY